MKKKNLKRYREEFDKISDDSIERIINYMVENKFTNKDVEKVIKRITEIQNISKSYLKIVFDIIPEPTPRPRSGFGGRFYVKNAHSNNEFVQIMVKEHELKNIIHTPCIFRVKNYFPIPKSFSKVDTVLAELGYIPMVSLPDWDNLGKTYSDMVQQWILCNDSLIYDGGSEKHYSLKPRVEILIIYNDDYESNFTKRLIEKSVSYKSSMNGVDQK